MLARPRRVIAGLLLASVICPGATEAAAAGQRQWTVLSLYTIHIDSPFFLAADPILRSRLSAGLSGQLDYYPAFMDLARFPDPEQQEAFGSLLDVQFRGRPIDLIIANGDAALAFVRQHRDRLFAGVPVVFHAMVPTDVPSNATGLWTRLDLAAMLESALAVDQGTRHVAVVSGASQWDRAYESVAREQLAPFESRLTFSWLTGLPRGEVLDRVARLPPSSLVLFLSMTMDGSGTHLAPVEMIRPLSQAANAPLHAWLNVAVGLGAVGGRMISSELVGERTAALALRVLNGEDPETIPVADTGYMVNEFDWRQLRRWGIDERRLPAGSIVRFRVPGAWEQYHDYIIGGVLLMVLQSGLIVGLLWQRRRRRRVESALAENQRRYDLAAAAGSVGVWDWNLDSDSFYMAPQLKALLGFANDELPNSLQAWRSRFHPDEADALTQELLESIRDGRHDFETERRVIHKDGSSRRLLSRVVIERDPDGTPRRVVGAEVDVTARVNSREQLRGAIEAAPAGMILIDRAGGIVLVNTQVEHLFGYPRQELIGQPIDLLVPEHARGVHEVARHDYVREPVPRPMGSGRELFGRRRDGTEVPVEIVLNPLHTAEGDFVLGSVADITGRKQSEREREELLHELRQLAGSLIERQEAERTRIARELHDDVSQQVAALSIALSNLKRHAASTAGDVRVSDEVARLQARMVGLAETVRRLAHGLHPDVLKHAGLKAALTALCAALRTDDVECAFTGAGDFDAIDQAAALCLFRISQEALNNALKHAAARHVVVRLVRSDGVAELTIDDDGRGFDASQVRAHGIGLGLVGMCERARLAGGTVTIAAEPGRGTRVHVRVPLHPVIGATP